MEFWAKNEEATVLIVLKMILFTVFRSKSKCQWYILREGSEQLVFVATVSWAVHLEDKEWKESSALKVQITLNVVELSTERIFQTDWGKRTPGSQPGQAECLATT